MDKKLLLGCTGSVATIKLPDLVREFSSRGVVVRVVVTEHAKHFFDENALGSLLISDEHEWRMWSQRGDPVVHIDLVKWADAFLIAPLDANTLAKLSTGLCDNLLTCVARAWDFAKPIVFCPAMNTKMYEHPITSRQIAVLKEWGYQEIPVMSKKLACGDTGLGAMAEVADIVQSLMDHFSS